METQVQLSRKQIEYINNAVCRWNIKIGATQCGKTFIDVQYIIPSRIVEGNGKKGLNVILGVSKETIERNVLEPMRDLWGDDLVSIINSRNFATIFGEKVYCLGAEKVSQVSKLRGAKFKYVYIDEIVDINEQVFQLVKSRMSLPYSKCDAAGNPSYPNHFIKKFIDSADRGVDIYCQQWTLYDNPFLDPSYIRSLEREYAGTVYYDRYIKGMWTRAEGLVYPMFGKDCIVEPITEPCERYVISMDYGIQNPTAMILWGKQGDTWYALKEFYHSGRETGSQKTDQQYYDELEKLAGDLPIDCLIVDPSATSFIALVRQKHRFRVRKAINDVVDGIQKTAACLSNGKIKICACCERSIQEFGLYSWDDKAVEDTPIKENDHAMDAIRYFVNTMGIWRQKSDYTPLWN